MNKTKFWRWRALVILRSRRRSRRIRRSLWKYLHTRKWWRALNLRHNLCSSLPPPFLKPSVSLKTLNFIPPHHLYQHLSPPKIPLPLLKDPIQGLSFSLSLSPVCVCVWLIMWMLVLLRVIHVECWLHQELFFLSCRQTIQSEVPSVPSTSISSAGANRNAILVSHRQVNTCVEFNVPTHGWICMCQKADVKLFTSTLHIGCDTQND